MEGIATNRDASYSLPDALYKRIALDKDLHFEFNKAWNVDIKTDFLKDLKVIGKRIINPTNDDGIFVGQFTDCDLFKIELRNGWCHVFASGKTENDAKESLHKIEKLIPVVVLNDDEITVTFWSWHPANGPQAISRKIIAPTWEEIKGNYGYSTSKQFERLLKYSFNSDSGGKLILWHGIPGTGKTWALRALAQEWKKWADIQFILDPEQFFGQSATYMINVLLGQQASQPASLDNPNTSKWRLFVLEDSGEFITKDAKQVAGQGFPRLLNVCDGIIGQGLKILVLLTTNETIDSLHAAVKRPGRCIANVEFKELNRGEIEIWLSNQKETIHTSKSSATVAELFDLKTTSPLQESTTRKIVGFQPVTNTSERILLQAREDGGIYEVKTGERYGSFTDDGKVIIP